MRTKWFIDKVSKTGLLRKIGIYPEVYYKFY